MTSHCFDFIKYFEKDNIILYSLVVNHFDLKLENNLIIYLMNGYYLNPKKLSYDTKFIKDVVLLVKKNNIEYNFPKFEIKIDQSYENIINEIKNIIGLQFNLHSWIYCEIKFKKKSKKDLLNLISTINLTENIKSYFIKGINKFKE